ncbi:TPA: oligopeptide ABC transporter substrate-binding protein OppA [Escherichia coli]|nr:oligopeptide ABC transporter substrate-binding protein OppA [Escherichia coli]HAV9253296.1 oligopeptide ABC transporter substrate-binding protein OppA [Escherichia coli]HAW0316521.1 oligopeptide ABC transporter substrate-binding protein OppA [Escherichia coli]HAW1122912.1 oligopeptide ABC transporter substrate-binding protein OppA [Escherichia coli]HCH7642667.1 oligopeptide ABC transporter substrate-binding protein OppA [Escherichia coli]
MKSNSTYFFKLLSVLAVFSIASGVRAAVVPSGTELSSRQELVRNNFTEPASIDPHKAESDVEFNIIADLFDGLVRVRNDGTIEPRLAERWETQNGKIWTFHLRPGIRWSSGEAITAQDVEWSWKRLVNPETASPYASYPGTMYIENARDIAEGKKTVESLGVRALDRNTVQVTLSQPTSAFLLMLDHTSMFPVNRSVIEKFGDKWTQPGKLVNSGAYTLSEWVVNEKIVAVRNKLYWEDSATVINKVTYLPVSSGAADVNRYKAGEIDITNGVPEILYASLKKSIPEQVRTSPYLSTYYYEFNTTKAPFNDPRVRQALNMALDKDIITEKVLGQGQRVAWLVSQPEIGGVKIETADYGSWSRDKRIAEAKKLLDEAGFNSLTPLKFNLLYNISESHQRIAIAVSSMWKKNLGVEARLQKQEWKTLLDAKRTGDYDVVRYSWIADYDDAMSFLNNFRTGDAQNTTKYSNPVYDSILVKASQADSVEKRRKFYQQAEDILAKDVPTIPVFHAVRVNLVKPYIGGYSPDSLGRYLTRDMYIIKH